MALLPQMLQSIEVLQLATAELVARIEAELQVNETLEAAATDPSAVDDVGCDGSDAPGPTRSDDEDPRLQWLHNLPAPTDSLQDFLRDQLAFCELDAEVGRAVLLLAAHLDERGLLPFAVEQLAEMTGLPADLLAEALAVLQGLEPVGIGAAGPLQAMLRQVVGDPDGAAIAALLTTHLEALAQGRVAEVARSMGLPVDEVRQLLERIRRLEPRPAAAFTDRAEPGLRPDARVWLEQDRIQVAVEDGAIPALSINSGYAAMLRDRSTEAPVRNYLRGKVRSARELIDAVAQRRATLARVVAAVMARQPEFLVQGRRGIRPLRMADVAAALGLHTSTVSRAIAGKHVQTELGVFRLRDFFDGGGAGGAGAAAAGTGRMAVRETIAGLLAQEDPARPLSDDDLVVALAAQGVQVARRTVTKYRKELGIPSSFLRRRERR